MDEPGDDFLAGAGLAGDEHCRVRLRDTSGLLQHLVPFGGFAHYADLSLGFELVREQLHSRFEPLGVCLCLGGVSFRFDELLVRDRKCDVIGNAACLWQIALVERSQILRPERELYQLLTRW
jgi:hypothetical protein